jgi:hypothetical protein
MIPHGTIFEFEYLSEFEMEIKNILGHELEAHMGLIYEKKQRLKISCYCTFNAPMGLGALSAVLKYNSGAPAMLMEY